MALSSGRRARRVNLRGGKRGRHSRARGTVQTHCCGIVGIFTTRSQAALELYEGLLMVQHRGQDSAGIVSYDGKRFKERKDKGLVKDVFDKEAMSYLEGTSAIGHVRYPTAGGDTGADAQPFFVNSPLGMYLIHNGNLTNCEPLRDLLEHQSDLSFFRHLRTDSDSEVLLNVLADNIHRAHKLMATASAQDLVFKAARQTMNDISGAYSVITMVNQVGLFAFRDPHGIRPLVLGHRLNEDGEDEWAFASEDAALAPIGFERVRDVRPGEAILVTMDGELKTEQCVPGKLNPCIFEYIYLARPDSTINDIPVYEFQLNLGRRLASKIRECDFGDKIDTVVPVPDGSRPAAIEIASALNLPYREGLVKNRYVGRTFIMPSQRVREMSVKRKLNAMSAVFKGRNVLLVDDSIVRGTTMRQIVQMVRNTGAKSVYLASTSPPVRYPNVYGVDMPSRKEFVANGLEEHEVCEALSADGLLYQTVEDLLQVGMELNPSVDRFEASCFDGVYVDGSVTDEYLEALETGGRGKDREGALKQLSANTQPQKLHNYSTRSSMVQSQSSSSEQSQLITTTATASYDTNGVE